VDAPELAGRLAHPGVAVKPAPQAGKRDREEHRQILFTGLV
jgi:hypothetical protein